METHEVRYFLAVARALSFTKAAVACAVSQPALTRAIKKLESELGGVLFHRQSSGTTLTQLGRSLVPRMEEIERQIHAVRQVADASAKESPNALRLGVMCTIGPRRLVGLLAALRSRMPDLALSIHDASAARVVELLLGDEVDVALTAQPTYPPQVGATALFKEGYSLACPADHPLAGRVSVDLASIAAEPYLERLNCEFDQYYEALSGPALHDFDVRFSSEREDWIQALILAGEGCAIMPEHMDCLPGIAKRPLAGSDFQRTISIATVRGRPLSDAGQLFIRLAQAHKWSLPG